jgi:hypothetical protein
MLLTEIDLKVGLVKLFNQLKILYIREEMCSSFEVSSTSAKNVKIITL